MPRAGFLYIAITMQILSTEQIKAWDVTTISTQGMSALDLMEAAASVCTDWIATHLEPGTQFLILCGSGNNGGDGLAIARLLHLRGYGIQAFLVGDEGKCIRETKINLDKLRATDPSLVSIISLDSSITLLSEGVVIIDALLGTGTNRPVEGDLKSFINGIDKLPNQKIAIDLPSGMSADDFFEKSTILKASHTLTLGSYKRSLLHPETGVFAGKIHLLSFGLDEDFPTAQSCIWHTLDDKTVQAFYKPRSAFSHKGTHGTALIVGGSKGLVGAALLASQGAGRAGAGKVRALVPECGYSILQTAAPEVMCKTSGSEEIETIEGWESAQGIGIGPGMAGENAKRAFANFLKKADRPIVLDAEAINILGEQKDLWQHIPEGSVLTPHPKEFERLAGATKDSFARAALARDWAMKHKVNIVLKDANTIILTPSGNGFYNLTGNAGLATGGSGDVLCGIITGLLAQNYSPLTAAMLGVWLHGKAGEAATKNAGAIEAVVAGDIVNGIGKAFASLGQ